MQDNLKNQLENVKKRLDEQVQQSAQKQYSEDMKDKQQELQKQMDNLLDNELKEQMKKLQELMQKLNKENAFEVMKQLREVRERFDVVIVDPPAFIKRKKDQREGLNAYRRINELALSLLKHDGVLVSCSCSHHLSRDELVHTVQAAVRHQDRFAQLLEHGYQGLDHPIHPAIAETDYLKSLFLRVLPA